GSARHFGQLTAEAFRVCVIEVVHGEMLSRAPARRQLARQLTNHASPLALRHLVLAHPKALGERHVDLLLVGKPLGFVVRTAYSEPPGRAPAKLDAGHRAPVPGL